MRKLRGETIEARILLSATWVDADSGEVLSDASSGDDLFFGDDAHGDSADGNSGQDTLFGGGGDDDLKGSDGADLLLGGAGADTLDGGNDNDIVVGGAGSDTIYGGDGADVLIGGGGSDVMDAGSGDDVVRFTGAVSGDVYTVDGGSGQDLVDLTEFGTGSVSQSGSTLTVSLAGGGSFQVDYQNVEQVMTADSVNILEAESDDGSESEDGSDDESGDDSDDESGDESDDGDNSSTATSNHGPQANAGVDQVVLSSSAVTLTAAGSTDFDGDILTYTWTQVQGPIVTLSDATAEQPTFSAPNVSSDTPVTFVVTVSDGTTMHVDMVSIVVQQDLAPVADAGADQAAAEGATVTLNATGSNDANGQSLTYAWVQTSGTSVSLSDASAESPTFTAPEGLANSTATFQVTVSDGTSSSVDTVSITINADNDAPTASAGPDQSVAEGATVTLNAESSTDPEGQALTYTWSQTSGASVSLSDTSSENPTFVAPEGISNSAVTFQVSVSDGFTTSVDTVTVIVNADDDAPTANAGENQSVAEGEVATLAAAASTDPEGQTLTYTWVQIAGPSVTLGDAASATAQFTAPELSENAVATFQVTVSDGTTSSIDTVTVTLVAGPVEAAPAEESPVQSASTEGGEAEPAGESTSESTVSVSEDAQTQFVLERNLRVEAGERVELTSTERLDASTRLIYTWTQVLGPGNVRLSVDGATATLDVPASATGETLAFRVGAFDGQDVHTELIKLSVGFDADTAEDARRASESTRGIEDVEADADLESPDLDASTDRFAEQAETRDVSEPPVWAKLWAAMATLFRSGQQSKSD